MPFIKKKYGALSFDEILVDRGHHDIEQQLETPIQRRLLRAFLTVMVLVLAALAARTGYLEVFVGPDLAAVARQNRETEEREAAPRGKIIDRYGNVLAENRPVFLLKVNEDLLPQDPFERVRLFAHVAEILQETPEELLADLPFAKSPDGGGVLRGSITREEALVFEVRAEQFPGFSVAYSWSRFYPYGAAASHPVGYLGPITQEEFASRSGYSRNDFVGRTGVETAFEEALRGEAGLVRRVYDAKGTMVEEYRVRAPNPGHTMQTTIDIGLQAKITEALEEARVALHLPKDLGAAAIALDPRNGEILSLVSLPNFDPNIFIQKNDAQQLSDIFRDPGMPLFNRVVGGLYPPGSIVKPFVAVAALKEEIISPGRKLFAPASITVPSMYDPAISWTFRDWRHHGFVDMYDALAFSSDVYFYQVGGGYQEFKGLGAEKLASWFSRFGFGRKLGVEIPGEQAGIIPTPQWKETVKREQWYLGDTYHMAIGQGDVLATPLQLAAATASAINGGTFWRPHFKKAVLAEDGTPREVFPTEAIETDIAPPALLGVVKKGMRAAVTRGTARGLQDLAVPAGAKTGTAQFGSEKRTHGWVTVFAPYEDPEVVLVVLIEGGGEGSAVAVPVARDILQWYFSRSE